MEESEYTGPFEREPEAGEPFSRDMRVIMDQWKEASRYWNKRYKVARRDKQFVQSKQWDEDVEKARFKKHLATVTWPIIRNYYNKQLGAALPESANYNIVNTDARPNTDSDERDDAEVAVLNGVIRYIDKDSNTEIHRGKARKDQFSGGIGWLGLDYVYSDSPSDGAIKILSPRYFDQVYIHPYFNEPDASDAEYSFKITKLPYTVAAGKYGKRIKNIQDKAGNIDSFDSFDDCYSKISTLECCKTSDWLDTEDKTVTIAEHHWRRKGERTFYVLDDVEFNEDQWNDIKDRFDVDEFAKKPEKIVKDGWYVEQRILCGWSVLEKRDFFIDRIPWTPVFGYTLEDGTDYSYHGIVHDGVQLQEHANWLASQHATKTSEANTIALINSGVLGDKGMRTIAKKGGIQFVDVDFGADGTTQNPAQIIQAVDNGSVELEQLRFTIELLREVMSTSNEVTENQVIRSAQQLQLHISDRDSVREELDVNFRMALSSHYSKVVEMIKAVYSKDDIIKVVNIDDETEKVGSAALKDSISHNYTVSVQLSPSGAVQKQRMQQLASVLMQSPDPSRQSMGLIMSIDNSEVRNKKDILKKVYKRQFAAGDMSEIPQNMLEEILLEQQETGQIQQTLAQMAEPIAQQRLQEMMQDQQIQLRIAELTAAGQKSQADVMKASLQTQRAGIEAERSQTNNVFRTGQEGIQLDQQAQQTEQERLRVLQQEELTKQNQLRTLQEFYEVQQKIAEARAKETEISAELIDRLVQIQPVMFIQ